MYLRLMNIFLLFTIVPYVHSINNRPIIGVLSQESNATPLNISEIVASYVKFLESAGARVVPIMIYQPKAYYADIMGKINGVLFPGGGAPFDGLGYGRAVKIIFQLAVEMNKNGDYFPLWGTCLGFEVLNFVYAKKSWMTPCQVEDLATSLTFEKGYQKSRMFGNAQDNVITILQNDTVTINYHRWCITPENYTLSKLNKFFRILSTSQDINKDIFISSIEAFDYPFYGIQFHPEKVLFEWVYTKTHHNIPHSSNAVMASQHFSNFFVNEARKSNHTFTSKTEEDKFLIYNYRPVFTGKENKNFEQMYVFLVNNSKNLLYDY